MQTILLVEDEEMLRKVVRIQLTKLGHNVIEAQDGVEAMELFEKHSVDIIITDLMMPRKNGLEVIAEIKKRRRDIKIIATSGGSLGLPKDGLEMARDLGADLTIEKPFGKKELAEALETVLLKETAH